MTKARDLANLISGGFTEADIPNLSASKITSGTFADARIAASNVSQHATSFDDNKLVNDISTLGLRVHSQENLNASNSNSASFDVFQDSSAISNLTNCVRSDSEFISSNIPASFNTNDATLSNGIKHLYGMDNNGTDSIGNQNLINVSGVTYSTSIKKFGTHSAYFNGGSTSEYAFDNGSGSAGTPYFHTNNSNGSYPPPALSIAYWAYWTPDNGNWNMVFDAYHTSTNSKRNYIFTIGSDSSGSYAHDKPAVWDGSDQNRGSAEDGGSATNASAISHNTWVHIIQTLTSTKKQIFVNGSLQSTSTGTFGFGSDGTGTHARIGGRHNSSDYQYKGNLDQFCIWDRELNSTDATNLYNSGNGNDFNLAQNNATGSFTGNNITAPSSVSKMGAVITYQDNAGTNALNTDIVLQLSADGGSNYSTATMTALPDFATGIKMAKVNDLSVTAGTSINYKISFANQSSGSKEARIRGVSLQY